MRLFSGLWFIFSGSEAQKFMLLPLCFFLTLLGNLFSQLLALYGVAHKKSPEHDRNKRDYKSKDFHLSQGLLSIGSGTRIESRSLKCLTQFAMTETHLYHEV